MTLHPAADWILDRLAPVVESVANDYDHRNGGNCVLKRVDRDNSRVFEGGESIDMTEPIHTRVEKLKTGNFVGVTFADRGGDLVGTEPMLDGDVVINVRLEGMTHREYGHIDPDGEQGIPFDELTDRVRDQIWDGLEYPDVDDPRMSYRYLTIDDDPQSVGWSDFYRHSFDVTLFGYESLQNQ